MKRSIIICFLSYKKNKDVRDLWMKKLILNSETSPCLSFYFPEVNFVYENTTPDFMDRKIAGYGIIHVSDISVRSLGFNLVLKKGDGPTQLWS